MDSHKFEIVHELPCDVRQNILDIYECLYMEMYADCNISSLNLRGGGIGGIMTEDHRRRISEAHKGKIHSAEHRKKNGLAKRGQYPASAKKVRDSVTGIIYPSARVAAEKLNIPHSTLKAYLNG